MADTFKDIFNAMKQGNGNVVMRGSGTNATINGTDFSLNSPQTSTNKTYGTWKEWANDYFKPIERLNTAFAPTRITKLLGEEEGRRPAVKRHINPKIDSDLTTREAARMKRTWKRKSQDELHDLYENAGTKLHNQGNSDEDILRKLGVNAETMESDNLPSYEGYQALFED